jgi:hypothetical protein
MIPKIIHYCWLSKDAYPKKIQQCLASWKKHLPNYEFMLWNFDRFDINSSIWVKQMFYAKRYASAADYIRLYALYYYGGIYLDMDVEIIKSFDDLLNLPYFIGRESYPDRQINSIEAAIMGAEKGCFWINKCLNYYENKKYQMGDDIIILPLIIEKTIKENFSLVLVSNKNEVVYDNKKVFVFPVDYFAPKKWDNEKVYITERTYTIHHYAGSWIPEYQKIEKKIWKLLKIPNKNILGRISKKSIFLLKKYSIIK